MSVVVAGGQGEVGEPWAFGQLEGGEDLPLARAVIERWATWPARVARVTRAIRSSSWRTLRQVSRTAMSGGDPSLGPGPPQRPLGRQPQRAQQPAHADRRQRHPKLAADQLAHHLPGPQRERELVLTRVRAGDQRIQPAHLRTGQLRRPARHRPRPQRLLAALPVLGQPPVDRAPAHTQRGRDILRMDSRLDSVHRPQPQLLQGVVVQLAAVVLTHGRPSGSSTSLTTVGGE